MSSSLLWSGWATACGEEVTPSRLCGAATDLAGGGAAARRQAPAHAPKEAATPSRRRPPAYTAFAGPQSTRLPTQSKVAAIDRITLRPPASGLPQAVRRPGRSVSPKFDCTLDREQVSRRAGSNDVEHNGRLERSRKGRHGSSSPRLGRIPR